MDATLKQAMQILKLVNDQNRSLYELQRVIDSGILSDVLSVNIDKVDRNEVRKALGLKPLKKTVGRMKIGDTGYIVPWAVARDGKNRRWGINPEYDLHDHSGGTVSMRVKKCELGHIHVYPTKEHIKSLGDSPWPNQIPVRVEL